MYRNWDDIINNIKILEYIKSIIDSKQSNNTALFVSPHTSMHINYVEIGDNGNIGGVYWTQTIPDPNIRVYCESKYSTLNNADGTQDSILSSYQIIGLYVDRSEITELPQVNYTNAPHTVFDTIIKDFLLPSQIWNKGRLYYAFPIIRFCPLNNVTFIAYRHNDMPYAYETVFIGSKLYHPYLNTIFKTHSTMAEEYALGYIENEQGEPYELE